MAKNKIIIIIAFLLGGFFNYGFSQFSVGGGYSSFHGMNIPIHRFGLHAFVEVPRSATTTFNVRAAYMLPNKDIRTADVSGKPGVTPTMAKADLIAKTSYFAVDGGTRFYFINDYDIGFSVYAQGYIKGILSSFRASYRMKGGLDPDDYETSDYPPQSLNEFTPQYSLLFAFGGSVGAKYQLPIRGAFTLDFGLEIISRLVDPYAILGNDISPLSYNLNLAYRFDWY